jgi:hypothetical protein
LLLVVTFLVVVAIAHKQHGTVHQSREPGRRYDIGAGPLGDHLSLRMRALVRNSLAISVSPCSKPIAIQ